MNRKMTRKDFVRAGLSVIAAGLTPLSGAKERASGMPADYAKAPLIRNLNPVIRLYPAKAIERTGDIRFGAAEIAVM